MRLVYLILTVAFFVFAGMGHLSSDKAVCLIFSVLGVAFLVATNYSFEQHFKPNDSGDF